MNFPGNQNSFYNHERSLAEANHERQSQSFVSVQHLASERIDVVWRLSSLCVAAKNSWRHHRKPRCTRIVRASPVAFDTPKALYRSSFDVGTLDVMSYDNTYILLYTMSLFRALGITYVRIYYVLSQIRDW